MGRWKEKEFETLYEIPSRNGLSKPSKIRGNGFKMINMGELFANDRIYDIPMELVPCNEKEQENAKIEKNDLLFARQSLVEAGAGKCSIVMEVSDLTVFESHIIRVRLDNRIANPMFYYYYFKSGMSQMYSIVQHSVQAGIKASDLAKLPVIVPALDIQKKIADFISTIDLKIENNNAINRNLLEQAGALFKSWFEDYEPWNGKKPSNWHNGVLGDFVTIKRGGSPRPIQQFLSDEGLRWLKISDVSGLQSPYVLNIAEHIIEAGLGKTILLKKGALVLSNSATPGIPKILDVDSCIHDGWLYFPESQLSKYFLYLFYKSIRPKLVALGNGSVFTNLKTDILKEYVFSKPDNDTLNRFDYMISPLFKTMREIARENHRLTELRDTLLPKLMSGELDVSKIDI